jgi:hypothetical protein
LAEIATNINIKINRVISELSRFYLSAQAIRTTSS